MITFLKTNAVLVISIIMALITCIFVPIDKNYIDYFDFKTLTCLFCTLLVVCAFKNIGFFRYSAQKIVSLFKTQRSVILALMYVTFIGSMIIANDMALITFLPLGYYVLKTIGCEKYMSFTFIMQNICANLGGMLTPFGNPQNLYLYTRFNISNAEFIKIMFLPFIISIILFTLTTLKIPNKPLEIKIETDLKTDSKRVLIYSLVFIISVLIVFRIFPYIGGLIIVSLCIFIFDKKAFKKVDYPLLLTFCAFFVFSGNLSRIDAVKNFMSDLISRNVLFYSTLSCQFISNVPSSVLLSHFTDNYAPLLVGVNIGGVGTIIASLASLITFRHYNLFEKGKAFKYLKEFSFYNFSFLLILFIVMNFIY